MVTGIGETLRAARQQAGATLADAAGETRVRESYLAALEDEDFAVLGGDVYVKGFLRGYARFLGLDPEPLLERYRDEVEVSVEEPGPLSQAPVEPMIRERRPGIGLAAGAVLVVLVVLGAIGLRSGSGGQPDVVPPAPPAATTTATSTAPPFVPPTEEDIADQPAVDSVEVTVELDEGDSWLRVRVDGEDQIAGAVFPQGTERTFEGEEEVEIRIGNAGAVLVTVNGRELGRLGDVGEAITVTYDSDDVA